MLNRQAMLLRTRNDLSVRFEQLLRLRAEIQKLGQRQPHKAKRKTKRLQ